AIVYPLKVEEGEKSMMEESITFVEMYPRKMSMDLELANLKKLSDDRQHLEDLEKEANKWETKPLDQILA
ncbi:Envelope glycoprotein gp160, partial [Stylosanthes scabra]|nr:Envelope glycoprotein gp160 [Stylosanthes scabra]